jgi:hypothetical protein
MLNKNVINSSPTILEGEKIIDLSPIISRILSVIFSVLIVVEVIFSLYFEKVIDFNRIIFLIACIYFF